MKEYLSDKVANNTLVKIVIEEEFTNEIIQACLEYYEFDFEDKDSLEYQLEEVVDELIFEISTASSSSIRLSKSYFLREYEKSINKFLNLEDEKEFEIIYEHYFKEAIYNKFLTYIREVIIEFRFDPNEKEETRKARYQEQQDLLNLVLVLGEKQ